VNNCILNKQCLIFFFYLFFIFLFFCFCL
jgi:hypothetical protein